MLAEGYAERRTLERLPRGELRQRQLEQLNQALAEILPTNEFYARKLAGVRRPLESLDELADWPFTTKDELIGAATGRSVDDPLGSSRLAANRTFPLERYVRFHRTSGTRGEPLIVLDTPDDWRWWLAGWQFVLDAAELQPGERAALAFSFGPFIGFWSAFDAVVARGGMAIPTGGMSSTARLRVIESMRPSAVLCTPSYALHLATTAEHERLDLTRCGVRAVIVAGEPGGSIAAVRQRIEKAWGARVIDHAGSTEGGPWGYGDAEGRGLYVNESQFIAEWIDPTTGRLARPGELAELVLTTLGRTGAPVIRYRTGDLARPEFDAAADRSFAFLPGGILGRADDMLTVRGVNLFPSSLDDILWSLSGVREYRATVSRAGDLDALSIEVECDADEDVGRIAAQLQMRIGLRADVRRVAAGTLPRFEAKGRRTIDARPPSPHR